MGTVTINANPYPIYNTDLPAVKLYLAAAIGPGPDAWNASVDDNLKSKLVATAKRYLDEQMWQGLQTVPYPTQTDAWPRTGVVDAYKIAVDSTVVPVAIKSAECELAAILLADPSVNSAIRSGSNVRMVDAKGVKIDFFRPTDTAGTATKLPVIVQRLVGQYLASAIGNDAAAAFYNSDDVDTALDTCVDSAFDDDAIMDRSGPMG